MVISDDPRRFEPGSTLHHADGRVLTVRGSRKHSGRVLVEFEGIDSREAAEGLRGALFVDAAEVRELEEDEYWPEDLVGCEVFDIQGTLVGTVRRVVESPAHDLLEVGKENAVSLVPVVKEIVRSVDISARRIVIDPPEGLLEP